MIISSIKNQLFYLFFFTILGKKYYLIYLLVD